MNKIFKVIWSKSKQCYIVVSEMAKNHSGKKKIVVASILAAMAVGSGALVTDVSADPVRGGVSLAGGETKTDATIAIGSGSYSDGTAVGGDGSRRVEPGIAIGVNAKAMGNSNVVMGLGSQIIGHSFGVAIGRTAQATDDYGVSVGYNTHADLHGIAMGEQSRAKKTGATSFGVSSRGYGNGAIAVGWQSLAGANVYDEKGVPNDDINSDNGKTINDYDKWGDVAIGIRTIATGGNATALGRGATASAANAIAIGGGDGGEPTKSGNTASDNKEKTKATAEKAVAIGYKALASDKSATSIGTDAQASKARATAIGYEVRAVGKNAVAIGSSGENSNRKLNSAGENAISIGTAAQANNNESTAIGKEALASNTNAIALGTGAEGTGNTATAIGYLVKATESNAFAAGSESLASGKNSISIGSTFNNTTNQSTGEASIAIGAAARSTGAGSVALGRNVQSLREYTTAIGTNITASKEASGSTIIGYNSFSKANQSVNIGSTNETHEAAQYSTAIGYDVRAKGKNAVAIGSSADSSAKVIAAGADAIAIGTSAQGNAVASTAIGKQAVASGENSIAFGTSAKGVGASATAIGNGATTANANAIALGTSAQGTGESATAIGNGAQATDSHAFAAGVGAKATGSSAIAVGNSASAAKANSVAIGTDTTASEKETVAVGLRASANGLRSVSVGIDTESTTADGVSVGYLSKSKALGAVAIGRNAVVTAEKSTAVGYDLTVSNSASTNIGYTSTVNANQATSIGARNLVESGAQYGTALGYFVNISGKNAIGIGSSGDVKNVVASAENAAAIGTSAWATASSAMALGTNANAALAHSVALGEGSTTTEADGAGKTAYLSGESTNNSGNGVISVGNKRNDSDKAATITRRIVSVAGGTDDYDAVNVKQLKALESNEWLLRTQNTGDRNPTDVDPQTVNGQTKKRVTLKGSENISISNTNGVVTLNVTNVVKSVATDNTNALDISNTNGAVKINPKLATSVDAAGEANKLVTAGTVKTALDLKVNKADELHVKPGNYTVQSSGDVSLIQENANSQTQGDKGFTIKDIAKKSVVDTLQSDYNTFKTKAITFTGDDNQGVARRLDTTLTVKGGANYTSTTPNTNIRVEKDAANGANGLLVKLSDKLSGMKEIAGNETNDLVIKNGNTAVTVKAPANGDTGTVDFGKAKVVAPNLDASIKYRANDDAAAKAKSVKLADGFNFVASKDATTTAEGPKSGLAIKAEDNGKVTFGLDKATRSTIDNVADKNLSNLTQEGKNKVTELAKTAAKEAVKVAPGLNTTVTTDTSTAGVTTYKVNANDTTVTAGSEALTINNATPDTNKVRAYTVDLSATTKGKLAAVGNLATNVIGGTTIATDGTVTRPTFSITKADGTAENAGTIKEAIEKLDAANKGQNTKISDTADKVTKLATALGGGAKVENGTFTGPTYNITKADGTGTETASNVGEAITKLDTRITTANGALVTKGLDFTGNDTTDAGKVHRDLGTTLTIKGAENFTRAAAENNIKVVKNGDALDVKLAENLAKMKEISGDGSSDLVIKNGDTKVTVKAPTSGDTGTVDFGKAKVVAPNLDASISYKAGNGDTKKTVKLQDGFNFTAATDTTTTAEGPKSGLAITTGANGEVTFGLDKATRSTIDNAADKDLSNLSDTGKTTVKELAKGAAQDAVKVADGINTTVEKDTATAGITTYKVNANDTTVTVTGDGLAITGGDLGTDKVRKYSLDLSAATKGKLAAVGNLATNVIGGTTIAADGTVTGPTFSITKADGTAENAGTIKEAIEKLDSANKGQNTKISDTADKVTKLGETVTNNYTDLSTKITQAGTNVTNALTTKGLNFTGNDTTDAGKVHRDLGTTLTIKGAENFTREANAKNNIDVVKNTAGDGFDVKLAANLTNMKEISGNGKDDLVIKNGDATITLKPKKEAEGTNPATSATVDFGETKVVASNLDANIAYKAGSEDTKKKVKLQDGFNFTAATDASTTAEGPKSGLAITTGDNGVVTFGLDKATRSTIDNAADKNLSNLSDAGKDKVKELAKGAAQDAVKVANGINTTVTTDTTTTSGVTTYKVNANDTTVAVTGDGLAINGGDLGADKVRKYTLDLSAATKGKLAAVGNLATNVIGGTTIATDGTVTGPTFSITKADGTNETANTLKDAIDKLNVTNAGQNTKISETAGKVTTLEGKVNDIVDKGMTFAGDNATADKVTRKLGETLNIHGQNNISVKKDGTAVDTLNVKLASDLKNITSISSGDGTTGSKVTLDANGVSIANTAAGQDGAAGTTKTVTIGKDGINAGGMKITNVAKAEAEGDAANKKYVDDAISNLDTTIRGNATLNFAGNVTKDAQDQVAEKVGLSLATGTLHVNGANNEITTTAKGDTITVGLAQAVKDQLAKVGDTASNGRDGKDGASGAKGLTGKDGLNDKTLTEKVNALRNGEAGSVVYTNDAGDRVVKAKDGKYYKADEVKADGTVKTAEENNGKAPKIVENPQARVVNGNGETTVPTTLSNIADGKVAAGSKDAVNGGQLNTVKTELATALGGGAKVENGVFTGPTYNITKDDGTGTEATSNVGEAISKLDGRINNTNTTLANKGLDFTGNDTTAKVHRNLGETLTIKGAENFTREAAENNIKVVKNNNDLDVKLAANLANIKSISNATGAGKPGSTITLDADGVSIANTAAGQDGAVGETKTVTIGKDGINAGGMKITNVTKAEADGDAANKKYVDDAISNLNTTVTNNANLRYAGDTNEGATNGEDHLNLPLATGTLKVAGTADQIKTVANNGTITLSLDEKVTNKLAKLGDTASNGRDGANGLTGKDGLNDKTLTEKVNALRNGEAGSVVYTDENGVRLVKAKDGEYYKAADVDKDGNVLNGATKATTVEARLVNPKGETTVPTKLSNIADGKVAAGSKDAVNGGQLYTAKSEIGAIIGGTTINENGKITGPTFSITNAAGTKDDATTIKDAIEKLDATNEAQNTKINDTAEKVTTLDGKVDGIVEKGMVFAGDDATADKVTRKLGETLNIHGQNNITVKKDGTAVDTLNVKLASDLKNITSISSGDGTTGSKVTLDANGVSIANTAAGQDGAAGETKTVTIGKDGINAGGMKITNVTKAEADGDAANKKYVDDAITNLNTTVTNNANLRYAGDTNVGATNGEDHLSLPLATGTLKVAGTADQIKTVANNGTITLSLDEKVTNKLNKLGDTASNGRDGANGTSGATGLTGKDGLNDKTLTDKVNALRNGEAGSVVYTNDAGDRVVKAKDGKYYKADEVKADGTVKTAEENNGKAPKIVENPQARVVNGNGETTVPTTLSNIADGKVAANSKEAVNGGQLHTVKSDLATALGGDSKVNADGSFTGPTYNITKDDGSNTKEEVKNVGDAISKLDGRINNANTTLATKGLDFTGNDTTAKVHRDLGTTLTIKGAENFTREANAKNNIDVVKNTAGDGFDVKLAENLGNIKEIAGNGKDDLVIKNGDATITLKPKKEAEGTNPATPATVDFGDTKVVASNLDASIKYRANDEAATNAKSVKLADGFNFVASTDATTTAEGPKSGLAITAEDNGKVTFGLDKATREKVDNAADKNLSNLTDAGKNKVKELAGEAAKAAVTVADGINTTVTTDTTTTTGVTTYKVNANDTTVAVNADSLAIAGGDLDATTKVRAYTLDLSDTVKAKLNAINNVGDTASNGRDGVNGTSGVTGLTGKDGLNDKTLTDKVNALRNGEAGSVVYTNDAGDRVVKAKDGKYYKADEVKADGTVKTAEENKGKKPEEVTTPQARVVNPNGETTAPTTLSNIADGKVAADSKEAVNGGQLNTVKSDLATALGGGAKVENGVFTGPTYNITKDDGSNTTEAVNNVGDAISKLDGRINNANTVLGNKGLDFYGNKDTADTDKVHRNLGEALKVKGAENFTREANAKNNIDVVKNTAGDGFDVKLAENLGNIKEIAGNGKDDLVIKNGDATITLKPKKDAEGTNPATPATVNFGNTKVVAPNLEASITYRANSAEDADAKTVTLRKGLNFVSGDGTAATAEAAKAGITIAADKDGKVVFGLNEATRNAIDNAADKNLSNLSQEGKDKVADLAKTAARDAVKVTAGNNVTVTSETKDGNTTYTVNGRDTTVKAADNGSVSVTGGTLNAKGEREYTVDLTADAKAELGKISDLNTRLGSAEGKITTLQGDMTKAKDDIAANTKAIDANKEAIAANKNAIADNARDIAANRKDIDANKQGIAENKKQIGENVKAIAKNAEDIKKNVEDTKKNTQDIKKNADAIKANTDRIQTVENRVTTAEGKIATNEQAIKDNASAIQSNTKAIGANTTGIAKNASDITKANKEIESLKGNSATKDLSNLTNTGKDTITNLINVTGEHGITVTPSTDTTTRVKTFTAKLNDTVTFGSGDKKITVDGTTGTVTSKAVAADTVKANTVNAKTVQLGDSTGTNTTVTADGIAVTTKNSDGTTSKVEIKNGTVSGLTNTKWDPAKVVTEADRSVVATQGQVKDVTDTLARGRVFVGDTGNTVTVGLGDTLAIKGGSTKALTDDNIGVVSTEAKDGKPATMTVKLAKNVNMKDGSTSYDSNVPEVKINPDGSKEIVKNADGTVKYQLGEDGKPIHITTTVNAGGVTIAPNQGSGIPTVSLTAAGLDNGGHQIHNVAAGTANTDAATVGQVRAAAHALNNRVNEAGAHAAALAAMNPLSYDPLKKSQVMAGVGSYKGNKALALGVAHYANEDTLFNVGVSVGNGENMVNAGVTYRFGGEDSMIPERYKGGPISSVYVMQDEITALKAENARKDAENAKKEAENEEMKTQIKMLIERVTMLEAKK